MKQKASVRRWENPSQPDANELTRLMQQEGLRPYSWSNGPGDHYSAHRHSYDKIIYVASGSITFTLPATGDELKLEPGDRIELPAGTLHSAVVGSQGVVCLEAQLTSTGNKP